VTAAGEISAVSKTQSESGKPETQSTPLSTESVTYQSPHYDDVLTSAPMPSQPIPNSNATPGNLTDLIIG